MRWQVGVTVNGATWGVRADLDGYLPFVPHGSAGATSLNSVMLADYYSGGVDWIQPGWMLDNGTPGYLDGYHSWVQVRDNRAPYSYDIFFNDGQSTTFVGADPVPSAGATARYAVLRTDPNGTHVAPHQYDVKLAGVGYEPFILTMEADSTQVFGELSNQIAQFPGDVTDHVKNLNVALRTSTLTWPLINSAGHHYGTLGYGHPDPGAYGMWETRCTP